MNVRCVAIAAACVLSGAGGAHAQTDYYNTDAGRPVRIEDAYPVELHAFELQAAPIRLTRQRGGLYEWGFEPEIAWGVLPRLQVEVGVPTIYRDRGTGSRQLGLTGVDLSLLYNLNVETATLPALAVAGDVVLPVGNFAENKAFASAKAIATRTYRFARFHVNAQYTFGSAPTAGNADDLSRWMAGVAVDKTFPLRSMLVIGEVYAEQPLRREEAVSWNAGAGIRYQLTPRWAVDAGLGKTVSGGDGSWHVTFGSAYAFAVRSLLPGN
jgi:hypothetical protein